MATLGKKLLKGITILLVIALVSVALFFYTFNMMTKTSYTKYDTVFAETVASINKIGYTEHRIINVNQTRPPSNFQSRGIIEYILIGILVFLIIRVLYNLFGPAIRSFIENLLENVPT